MAIGACPNYEILSSLSSTLDRLEESAWDLRMMEQYYHKADCFRWSMNSFLRSLKEVVQLLTMDVQNKPDTVRWLREEKERLTNDQLIEFLFKQRDTIVYRAMLKPASKGMVGFTRGRGLKLGLNQPIDPLADSEDAILRYIHFAAKETDFLGILYTEEDGGGEYTCVQREWRMKQFPESELTELAAGAWKKVGRLVLDTATKLGASVIEPEFELGNPDKVQFEIYRPEWVKEQYELAKSRRGQEQT